MRVTQLIYDGHGGWATFPGSSPGAPGGSAWSGAGAQLVLVMGDRLALEQPGYETTLRRRFPKADVVYCSTGGEILGDDVLESGIVATGLEFTATSIRAISAPIGNARDSQDAGRDLAARLIAPNLRHVLVFSEGLQVNGSALAAGFVESLPRDVAVTGGLSADGERFERTIVGLNEMPASSRLVAVGLYGDRLRVGMGTLGGWETVGGDHRITRSAGNVLHELDGEPALRVYRRLIGPHAYGLPVSGLLFPFEVRSPEGDSRVVRTILGVDNATESLTFAGDVPEGRFVRLMRANLDRLIDAAGEAAGRTSLGDNGKKPTFALLVSCIGRKLLLQRRVREEILSVRRAFGEGTALTGFYSYGELSPMTPSARCELHNQTMTITTLSEA